MTDSPSPTTTEPNLLASAFDTADRNAWRTLVDKALKGADFDKRLVAQTADGIRIEPIYARDQNAADDGVPGAAPFNRGTKPKVDGLGWQIHQLVTDTEPQAANRAILDELEAGTNGVVVQVASPGMPGVSLTSRADVVTALAGAYLDFAPIQFKAGLNDTAVAGYVLDALDSLDVKADEVCAHLNIDPIGNWARWGSNGGQAFEDALVAAISLAKDARKTAGKLRTINVDATIAHEAGASEGQELAYLAASLVAYLRAFEGAGVSANDAFAQMTFTLTTDDDIFTSLAKLRAARRMICRIADASGVDHDTIETLHITARTSERMLAKRDPWTNILRTTVACAAAAFAGTEAITVHPFTWALGQPDTFARRIARNTQIVCQEESSLGRVVDPAGGSWYVENLTKDLAETAWGKFQDIEGQGGIAAALKSGHIQDDIAKICTARDIAIAKRRHALTGVSEFPILGDDGVTVTPWPAVDSPTTEPVIAPLTPHRLAERFEALRDEAERIAKRSGAPPRIFLANIGRIVDHNARSTWVKNLLAAGGIEALTNDGFENGTEAAKAFQESGTRAACICSSDALYDEHAADTAKTLKALGANLVLVAGKPGDKEDALTAAGVDYFLYDGLDVAQTLDSLLKNTG